MGKEVELKLAVTAAARRALLRHPLLRGARQLHPARKLLSIYYDTPKLDLYEAGIALRLRRQGRHWVQTVKQAGEAAGGLSDRPEWETPSDGRRFDFSAIDDARLRKRLERLQLRAGLQPVFETNFTRRVWSLTPSPEVEILLMLDGGRIASGARSAAISELELELANGQAQELLDLALRLADRVPLLPEPLSKAERGYRLFQDVAERPTKATAPAIERTHGALGAFRAIAFACIEQIQANQAGARTGADPEFVHQMRVGLRRLRSALRLYAPLLPAERLQALKPRLRQFGRMLGEVRDWDVLATDVLRPVLEAYPEDERLHALSALVACRRTESRVRIPHHLDSAEHGRLMLQLLALVQHVSAAAPTVDSDGQPVPALLEFADSRLRSLQKRVLKQANAAVDLAPAALHQLRIAIKRWRYALEFFAPLYPRKRARRNLRAMTALQEDLGLLNDIANAKRHMALCTDGELPLREAAALVAGWYGPRHQEILGRLPGDIEALLSSKGKGSDSRFVGKP